MRRLDLALASWADRKVSLTIDLERSVVHADDSAVVCQAPMPLMSAHYLYNLQIICWIRSKIALWIALMQWNVYNA